MTHTRRTFSALLAAAAPSLASCARDSSAASAAKPAATPASRAASPGPATVVVDSVRVAAAASVPAQLYVERDAVVVARAAGLLETLAVDIGSEVAAGQIVGRVESARQARAVERAEAAADVAHRAAERLRALLAVRGATSAEVEQAELVERQTRLALDDARRELALTRVGAPFRGAVTARYARAGRVVAAGDTLLRVAERGPLLARARVPEGAADGVRPGDAADVVARDGAVVPSRVVRVAPAIDATSGTREVVVRLADGAPLLAGASVRVRVGRQERAALAVPADAVQSGGYVLVVAAGGTMLRSVALGDTLAGGRVEVLRGLAAGERVARGESPSAPTAPR